MDKNEKKVAQPGPIENPELDTVIQKMKESSPAEMQGALVEALKTAKLLSPCDFDVDVDNEELEEDGELHKVAHPSQIKFYMLNTNDGKILFPAFTNYQNSTIINYGEGINPKMVVRQISDYDKLLMDPKGKSSGIIINPGKDNIVIPRNLVGVACDRLTMPKKPAPSPAPLNIRFTDPSVYPTKVVNAVYERCCETPEISRVWLKAKVVGTAVSFYFAVESSEHSEHILNEIREVAVPQAKDVPVEVEFTNERIMKQIIKDSIALYDKNLEM